MIFEMQKIMSEILEFHEQEFAERLFQDLILKCEGQSVDDLRKSTLALIRERDIPERISRKLKTVVETFISNLDIPAQRN